MTTVMISFRQPSDTAWGGRVVDQLRRVLVTDQLTIVDSASSDGQVPAAALALVVIGPGWLGEGSIHESSDPLRQEVEAVLATAERVVPVLVGGAQVPAPEVLPAPLRSLTDLPPVQLSDDHFREDVDQLSLTLLATNHAVRRREHEERAYRVTRRTAVAGFVLTCLAGLFLPLVAVVAMVVVLASRGGLRRRGGTHGLALANVGFGLAVFCAGFNVFFLIDQFS
jgi:hypothetical protein